MWKGPQSSGITTNSGHPLQRLQNMAIALPFPVIELHESRSLIELNVNW